MYLCFQVVADCEGNFDFVGWIWFLLACVCVCVCVCVWSQTRNDV